MTSCMTCSADQSTFNLQCNTFLCLRCRHTLISISSANAWTPQRTGAKQSPNPHAHWKLTFFLRVRICHCMKASYWGLASVVMKALRQSTPQPRALMSRTPLGGKYFSQWSGCLHALDSTLPAAQFSSHAQPRSEIDISMHHKHAAGARSMRLEAKA